MYILIISQKTSKKKANVYYVGSARSIALLCMV